LPRGPLWCRSWPEVCDDALVARVHVVKGHVARLAKALHNLSAPDRRQAAPVRRPFMALPPQRTAAFA